MQQFLLNSLAALLGALIAGAIGYFFAIHRFFQERAFERRLAWHERTVAQLVTAAEALRRVALSLRVPELDEDIERTQEEALAALPDASLLIEAEMYASPRSYRALKEARRDQGELTTALVQIHNTASSIGHPEIAERISPKIVLRVAKSMLHAASRLASDVRHTLGLGKLDQAARLYDDGSLEEVGDSPSLSALDRAKRMDSYEDVP